MSVRLRAEPIQLLPLGPVELDFLWEGPCEETPERNCIVTMDAPRVQVNVYFYRVPEDATSETLTVSTTGAGTGRVISDPCGINCQIECSSSFRTASVVTLTAVPDVDSVVVGWSASGSATFPSSSQIRFTMDGPREVTARFELREYPVTVTKTGEGAGRVFTEPAGIDCGADCEGGFPVGTTVTLRAEPDEDSRLVSLAVSGATELVSPGVVRFTVQGAREVNARFEPIYRTVTVTKTGDGSGRVFTEPAGIDCGAVCEVTFRSGTTVTVTAEADADSGVASFSASGTGEFLAPNIVRFMVREDRQVSVRFDLTGRPVTVSRWGDGDGRVTSSPAGIDCGLACQSSFPLGTTVTLLATPAPYSAFGGWSASGAAEFPSPREIRFTVDAARTVSARFNRTANLLDVRKTGTGRGTVSSRPSGISCGDDCTEYFPIGATVTLSAAPSPDSKFAGWGGACSGTGTCTVSMGSSQLVTADFVYAPYWLEVGKLGDGNGRVVSTPSGIDCGADCTENYAGGRLVALEATPAPGSEFVGWNWGTCPGTGSCVVIMNELRIRVSAIFRRVSYSLSVTKSGSGSGLVSSSPSGISCGSDCSEWYAIDSAVSLSATANSGSIFTGWGGACSGTGLCTVTMDASKNVTANFSPALTRLTVSKSGTGTGTVSSNPGGINCGRVS